MFSQSVQGTGIQTGELFSLAIKWFLLGQGKELWLIIRVWKSKRHMNWVEFSRLSKTQMNQTEWHQFLPLFLDRFFWEQDNSRLRTAKCYEFRLKFELPRSSCFVSLSLTPFSRCLGNLWKSRFIWQKIRTLLFQWSKSNLNESWSKQSWELRKSQQTCLVLKPLSTKFYIAKAFDLLQFIPSLEISFSIFLFPHRQSQLHDLDLQRTRTSAPLHIIRRDNKVADILRCISFSWPLLFEPQSK